MADTQWSCLNRNNLSFSAQPWPSLSIQVEKGSEEWNLSPFQVLPPPRYKVMFPPAYGLCKEGTHSTSTFPWEADSQVTSDTILHK